MLVKSCQCRRESTGFQWLVWSLDEAMALAFYLAGIWGLAVWHLGAEWSINTQYEYGWFVPVLALYLFWLRERNCPEPGKPFPPRGVSYAVLAAAGIDGVAFLFREANPEWRLLGWAFAAVAIGITLILIGRIGGWAWVGHFAFPILFFLTAVPWPRVQEGRIMMALMHQNAVIVAEALHWFGHSAVVKGNLVEIAGGVVGVDEACSGIRSLQGALMTTLFLGELLDLRRSGRVLLVLVGIGCVLLSNAVRTTWLGLIGATNGLEALARWHDPVGYTMLVIGFCAILAAATSIRRFGGRMNSSRIEGRPAWPMAGPHLRGLTPSVGGAFAVLFLTVAGAHAWFLWNERHLVRSATWTLVMPRENADYRDRPISEGVRQELHCDLGESGSWTDGSGRGWQASYFEWKPNRNAEQTVLVHDPRVCLQAHGMKFIEVLPDVAVDRQGARLNFEAYHFRDAQTDLYVFNCVSDDVIRSRSAVDLGHSLSRESRWAAVVAGIRHLGQRRLEVGVWGAASMPEARAAFLEFLAQHLASSPANLRSPIDND